MVKRIYEQGLRPEQARGYLRKWAMYTKSQHNDLADREYILYGDNLYVFGGGAMITVINAPSKSRILEKTC